MGFLLAVLNSSIKVLSFIKLIPKYFILNAIANRIVTEIQLLICVLIDPLTLLNSFNCNSFVLWIP